MSPSKFYNGDQQPKKVINGPRPSPLRINNTSKHSNAIQKHNDHNSNGDPPVIIYTHSPKIIHTKTRDFMALVQKLTGFSPSDDNNSRPNDLRKKMYCCHEEKESSSNITDDKNDGGDMKEASSLISPMFGMTKVCLGDADIPLFTPQPFLRYSNMLAPLPNMGNVSMPSPSFLEVMTDLPEY